MVKNISTGTVTFLGLIAGYQLATAMSFMGVVKQIDISLLVSNETDLYYFTVGFVLINIAIRAFVAKYPLRIYKSADKYVHFTYEDKLYNLLIYCRYVAVYGSQLPIGTVKHYFDRGQIAEYKNVLNPWSHIMYKLGQRSSLLLIDYFKTPAEFHKLFEEKQT